MRISNGGGAWRNTEDEVLKAGVMKYGKNEWDRVSTLVPRMSAKQCKARWSEWIDPGINKTEYWTRGEEEKLLHLAKTMPCQWRTVGQILGRPASQCLDNYEKLLGDDNPFSRKLCPGEIDPTPESKPARRDTVDMDEDEKEMLQQARARLANTQGKKAKRKAREKLVEEATRLASLQRTRELKAAGIIPSRGTQQLHTEIAFQKKPPPGFYEVSDDAPGVEQLEFPTTVEELQGETRVDTEARLRKRDSESRDPTSAVLQAQTLIHPPAKDRKRPKLNLLAPQIGDRDLEAIAKSIYSS
ncbi:hypothetical protein Vadar_018438 [Vaccinium darrowii]|uniref:Uncharacterized protein n=1 Tax=Vaccinium darrowii TaxID=229202 RepID=A0ACB7X214_9ERIC|nr:hypothetical protein Vadar_018438 [Vaccinium darrowii]